MALAIEASGFFTDAIAPAGPSCQTSAFNVGAGGRLIVVLVGCPTYGTPPTVSGVTDTLGNTYQSPANAHQRTGSGCAEVWYAWSAASGSNQVTVTFAQQGSGVTIDALCCVDAQQSLGAMAVGNGTSPDRALITPQALGSIIVGACADYASNTPRTVIAGQTILHEAGDDNNDDSFTIRLNGVTTSLAQFALGTTAPASTDYAFVAVEILAASGSSATETPSDAVTGATSVADAVARGEVRNDSATATDAVIDTYAPAATEVLSDVAVGSDTVVAVQDGIEVRFDVAVVADTVTEVGDWIDNAVDPITLPPNNQYPSSPDTSSRSQTLRDMNPSGKGDLLGLFKTHTSGDVYYMLLSKDGGASWDWLTATSGSPPATDGYYLQDQAICQDTVDFKIHWATVPQFATSMRYHRIVLAYSGDGHVSGWSWEASNQAGPALDTNAGVYQGKAEIIEVIDGASNHVLLVVGLDRPSATRVERLVAARTQAGASALAPTQQSHWVKLDGTAGVTVLCAKNTDTGVDATALLNLTNTSSDDSVHTGDCCAAQLSNGDLAIFVGPMYFNDPTGAGDIRRWRFTRNGTNWALDTNVNGAVAVAIAPDGYSKPCLGNCTASGDSAWLIYFDNNGLHVGSVSSVGVWSADGVAQPDTYIGSQAHTIYGWCCIGATSDGTLCVQYERNGIFGDNATRVRQFEGYWSGSAWQLTETSSLWRRSVGYDPATAGFDGSTSWSPIRGSLGAGVLAYPYVDWDTGHPHFSIHALQKPGGSATQAYEDVLGDVGTLTDSVIAAQAYTETLEDAGVGATDTTAPQACVDVLGDVSVSTTDGIATQVCTDALSDSVTGVTEVTTEQVQGYVETLEDGSTGVTSIAAVADGLEIRTDTIISATTVVDDVQSTGEESLSTNALLNDAIVDTSVYAETLFDATIARDDIANDGQRSAGIVHVIGDARVIVGGMSHQDIVGTTYFPAYPGISIEVTRSVAYKTNVSTSVTGVEQRTSRSGAPRYRYTLQIEFLRASAGEIESFLGFVVAHRGRGSTFDFYDPYDGSQRTCRFDTDQIDVSQLVMDLWEVKTLTVISVK